MSNATVLDVLQSGLEVDKALASRLGDIQETQLAILISTIGLSLVVLIQQIQIGKLRKQVKQWN